MEAKKIFKNAQRLFIKGKIRESITAFSRAIDAGETTEIAYLSRGVAYLQARHEEDAIKDFSAAVQMNDDNVRAHFYRGIAYMTKNHYKEAIVDFDTTIQIQPDNIAAYMARGAAYAQIGNEVEAKKNIQIAAAIPETSAHGLEDTIALCRTQFDRVLTIVSDKAKPLSTTLSDDEVRHINTIIDKETLH